MSHEYLYFNHNDNRAIRVGDWKLIATGASGPWELYDLGQDRAEQNNLAGAHTERVRQLSAKWKECDREFVRVRESSPPSTKRLMNPDRKAMGASLPGRRKLIPASKLDRR